MAQSARLNLRMQKEVKLLLTDPPPGVSILPLSDGLNSSTSSLTNIEARIEGPEGTVYSNGVYTIRIQIPERYPFHPPNVTFVTPIYHPNIDNGGRICLDILNLPPKGGWQPSLNIATVLTSIGLLLSEPNPDDGLMCETSREYKYNRQVFNEKARFWTERFAKPGTSGNIKDSGTVVSVSEGEAKDEQRGKESKGSVYENEDCRKNLRHISGKLSLTTSANTVKTSNDKENVAPFCHPLPSQPRKASIELAKPKTIQHTVASSESIRGHDYLVDDSYRNQKPLEECSKGIDMIIVSDSEDSDDEVHPVKRSRLSLLRKRIIQG